MKLLTMHATATPAADDFSWGIEGELAIAFFIGCTTPDCGCDRALVGLNSKAGSTTVKVSEVDIRYADAIMAAEAYLESAGWVEVFCGNNKDRVRQLADKLITESATVAGLHPTGTVLRGIYQRDSGAWAYVNATNH
jgi:hypothetical protein